MHAMDLIENIITYLWLKHKRIIVNTYRMLLRMIKLIPRSQKTNSTTHTKVLSAQILSETNNIFSNTYLAYLVDTNTILPNVYDIHKHIHFSTFIFGLTTIYRYITHSPIHHPYEKLRGLFITPLAKPPVLKNIKTITLYQTKHNLNL